MRIRQGLALSNTTCGFPASFTTPRWFTSEWFQADMLRAIQSASSEESTGMHMLLGTPYR
jgi:hypothetical protein